MPSPRDPNWASKLSTSLHLVRPYADEAQLVDLVARFLGVGLVRGESIVMLAVDHHSSAVCDRLTEVGFHLAAAREKNQLHVYDARDMLDRLLLGGVPDRERFRRVIGGVLTQAAGGSRRRIRVFGEMLDLCWRAGDIESALRLETFWNELQNERAVDVLVSYSKGSEFREAQPHSA